VLESLGGLSNMLALLRRRLPTANIGPSPLHTAALLKMAQAASAAASHPNTRPVDLLSGGANLMSLLMCKAQPLPASSLSVPHVLDTDDAQTRLGNDALLACLGAVQQLLAKYPAERRDLLRAVVAPGDGEPQGVWGLLQLVSNNPAPVCVRKEALLCLGALASCKELAEGVLGAAVQVRFTQGNW
jgi:hypothetical protein